jgi:uncharacterized membrane protein
MATEAQSIADALKSAVRDAQDLIRDEIALAKAELREEARRVGAGVIAVTGAAVAATIAVVFLLTTVALVLFEVFGWPLWAGFALMVVVVTLAAAALAYVGRRRLARGRHMALTVDTLKENMQWMRALTR